MKTYMSHHLQLSPLKLPEVEVKCMLNEGRVRTNVLTILIDKAETTYFFQNSELLKQTFKELVDKLTNLYYSTFEDTNKDEELPHDQPF